MTKMLQSADVSGEVFGGAERRKWLRTRQLQKFEDLIPRRSHAETSFGLLFMAANRGFEYGVFLDDDTVPVPGQDFFRVHLDNLSWSGPIRTISSDKKWVNVLFESFRRYGLYPRGYPYGAIGESVRTARKRAGSVVLSQGMWARVPDLDAVRILGQGSLDGRPAVRLNPSDFKGRFIVDKGNYLTISSMNLAFRREIIPAFYQLPMDDNPWGIGRFDDIWSGVLIKRICDTLGNHIITGVPICYHEKAPRSSFRDLNSEARGLELNEHFWELVRETRCSGKDFASAYLELALGLERPGLPYLNSDFLPYIAARMRRWVDCVGRLAEEG